MDSAHNDITQESSTMNPLRLGINQIYACVVKLTFPWVGWNFTTTRWAEWDVFRVSQTLTVIKDNNPWPLPPSGEQHRIVHCQPGHEFSKVFIIKLTNPCFYGFLVFLEWCVVPFSRPGVVLFPNYKVIIHLTSYYVMSFYTNIYGKMFLLTWHSCFSLPHISYLC